MDNMTTRITRQDIKKAKERKEAIKNVISKVKSGVSKANDKISTFITDKVMLKPSIDKWKGEDADKKREAIIRRRESIKNQKEMGY